MGGNPVVPERPVLYARHLPAATSAEGHAANLRTCSLKDTHVLHDKFWREKHLLRVDALKDK